MADRIERSIDELYQDDPERADAVAFGRKTGVDRRGFLGGAGLAAMGAAVGGSIPFAANMPGGLIPAALAQGQPAAPAPKGPPPLKFPGKDEQARRARRPAAGRRDAGAPARRRHHADRKILYPQQRADPRGERRIPTPGRSPSTARSTTSSRLTLGELKSKYKPVTRRMVLECGGNGRSAFSPPARGNQWTNGGVGCAEWTGVRARRRAQGGRPETVGDLHRALCGRPASVGRRQQADACRAACASRRRWTRTPDRVGDERQAAAQHPWRTGAADRIRAGPARRRRNG